MSSGWPLRLTRVPRAWTVTRGEGAVIAVIDDDVDVRHPAFRGRAPAQVITVGRPWDGVPWRRRSHGTRCAGVACAADERVHGVAPAARLVPISVPDLTDGTGSDAEARAIDVAVAAGSDVICCAWGPPRAGLEPPRENPTTLEAITRAARDGRGGLGAVIVWAAPNEDVDVALDPYAGHPDVLSVGASNGDDRRCGYGAWGASLFCVFPSHDPEHEDPRLRSVLTTAPLGHLTEGETWYTGRFGHTSAACAGVAGLCALVLSANPGLTRLELREVVRAACLKVSPEDARYDREGHSVLYGYGRPDAYRAVRAALTMT